MQDISSEREGDSFIPPENDATSETVGGQHLAKVMNNYMHSFEAAVAERKKSLLSVVPDGATVLEVGIGTGPNLRYLPRDTKVIGVEPNLYMWQSCRKRAEELDIKLTLHQAFAENLPLTTASVDVVLFTHVLCSVKDQEEALSETARVLRPGGRLLFLEHVLGPTLIVRLFQRIMNPVQRWYCGNCNLTCETGKCVKEMAARTALFDSVQVEDFTALFGCFVDRIGLLNPHVSGSARRTDIPLA